MKSLVIYDSQFGNTEKIAQAIATALDIQAMHVGKVTNDNLKGLDLLVIGSPVQAGNATMAIQKFIDQIPVEIVKSLKFATFDTRMEMFIAKLFGYAAVRTAKKLEGKGGKIVSTPGAFIVKGKEGPLKDGEIEKAAEWAKTLTDKSE
jgi:flavodoxin I